MLIDNYRMRRVCLAEMIVDAVVDPLEEQGEIVDIVREDAAQQWQG